MDYTCPHCGRIHYVYLDDGDDGVECDCGAALTLIIQEDWDTSGCDQGEESEEEGEEEPASQGGK